MPQVSQVKIVQWIEGSTGFGAVSAATNMLRNNQVPAVDVLIHEGENANQRVQRRCTAKVLGLFGNDLVRTDIHMDCLSERRKRRRMAIHWPVRLSRAESGESIETQTEDVSSDGFYFYSTDPFTKGERLDWMLTVPAQIVGCADLILCGQVQVARVKRLEHAGTFGVGCCIQDYSVVPILPSVPEPAEDLTPA